MVEFYGAALLAEEMEQLVQALLDGRVPNQGEALEVLMQAILQLPVYLDRIQTARRDLPMVVLPLLNDLRAARGEKLLSETSLFAPDLSQRQPQLDGEAIAQLRTDELGGLLRKLRQTQQMALVGLLRNQDVATSLGYLARVYARLEGLCREAPLGPLWSIASGLVEGLANGSVGQQRLGAHPAAPARPRTQAPGRAGRRRPEPGRAGRAGEEPAVLRGQGAFAVAADPRSEGTVPPRRGAARPRDGGRRARPPRRTRPRRDAFGGRCLVRGTGADQGQPRPVRAQRPWPPLGTGRPPGAAQADRRYPGGTRLRPTAQGHPSTSWTSSTPWPRAAASRATRS
ncbi:ChpA [Pseudomonas aeruginosa]|nr:ChpA [Pseudomonas aeruginosa]